MGNAVTVPSPYASDPNIPATNIAFGKTSYRENSRESTTSVNSAILGLNLTACHVCAPHSNDISERESGDVLVPLKEGLPSCSVFRQTALYGGRNRLQVAV